jgi:hypothetical protein
MASGVYKSKNLMELEENLKFYTKNSFEVTHPRCDFQFTSIFSSNKVIYFQNTEVNN